MLLQLLSEELFDHNELFFGQDVLFTVAKAQLLDIIPVTEYNELICISDLRQEQQNYPKDDKEEEVAPS